jgi:hypothetical protein
MGRPKKVVPVKNETVQPPTDAEVQDKYLAIVDTAKGLQVTSEKTLTQALDLTRGLREVNEAIINDFTPTLKAVKSAVAAVNKQLKGHTDVIDRADVYLRDQVKGYMLEHDDVEVEGVKMVPGKKAELVDIYKVIQAARQNPKLAKLISVNLTKAKDFLEAGIDVPGVKLVPTKQLRIYKAKK